MNTSLSSLREAGVRVPCSGVFLHGDLGIPAGAKGLVIFAHGSGSSRLSPRNRQVAWQIQHKRLATLLFDLLTPQEAILEAHNGFLRFDIPLLTERLIAVTRWARQAEALKHLNIGYFGASTGAAAALAAAANLHEVKAVVCRGGRTDLAGPAVAQVRAATLLIVGALDHRVVCWNHETFERLPGIKHLSLIEGATHLFSEPGALEHVAELASTWFETHLGSDPGTST